MSGSPIGQQQINPNVRLLSKYSSTFSSSNTRAGGTWTLWKAHLRRNRHTPECQWWRQTLNSFWPLYKQKNESVPLYNQLFFEQGNILLGWITSHDADIVRTKLRNTFYRIRIHTYHEQEFRNIRIRTEFRWIPGRCHYLQIRPKQRQLFLESKWNQKGPLLHQLGIWRRLRKEFEAVITVDNDSFTVTKGNLLVRSTFNHSFFGGIQNGATGENTVWSRRCSVRVSGFTILKSFSIYLDER